MHHRSSFPASVPPRRPAAAPLWVVCLTAAAATTAAACGGESHNVAPRLIPGGGVGDGAISGQLNVYVTDDQTRAPVAGASVRVGASAATAPCMALTDSTGLALFNGTTCSSLNGKQTLTVSVGGYAPTTWIGVNGANLTIPIHPTAAASVATATVSGTIAGWDSLPAPAAGHQTLAIVGFSQTRQLGDPANDIAQGKRTIIVPIVGATEIPANVCVRNVLVDDCAWQLTTRTGAQAHYAAILDQDTKGTPNDDSDDTFTATAWAVRVGLSFGAGQTAGGESLAILSDAAMRTLTVAMTSPPAGLDAVSGFPMLDLGGDGRIPITSPALDLTTTTSRVPAATGDLGGARYDLLAQAQDAKDKDQPATLSWLHGVDPAATVAVNGWLAPPGAIAVSAGTYSFTATAGATLHSADIEEAAGGHASLWAISIFDGSTSFTLPGLAPDPLPSGAMRLKVSALRIPGTDLANVSFDDAREAITGLASDVIAFTR
jgi:hypothetical protein